MIITTTQTVQNRSIQEYLGLVSGESVLGAKFMEAVVSGLGGSQGFTGEVKKTLDDAREAAINEMIERAGKMGAEAIVAVDVDYADIKDELLLVAVSGTAVKLVEYRD